MFQERSTMKSFLKRVGNLIKRVSDKSAADAISAYAGETTLFTILSFFPFAILLLSLFPFLPINEETVLKTLDTLINLEENVMFAGVINEIFSTNTSAVLSFSIITLLWSASRGFISIVRGLNRIYDVEENRNFVLLRITSIIYTVIFAGMILLTLALLVFGNSIFNWISSKFPTIGNIALLVISIRTTVIVGILLLFFILIYTLLPNTKEKSFVYELPGSILTSAGWLGFSYIYSIYVDSLGSNSAMYGSLSTIIFLMLWMYFCMFIFFVGAELNINLRKYVERKRQEKRSKKLELKD